MTLLAFCVLALMLTTYVVLDGYDLGVATITPLVARTGAERSGSIAAIGPFWNGNEVWLIASGAALFTLFPTAYALSFSGFYLPFMLVLWLLMFRGIALEVRNHLEGSMWHDFWDACFALSSALLVLLFGVALGNLIRGLPLSADGYFIGTFGLLLNPYALGVGLFALATLAQHGAAFLVMRVEGKPAERARRLLRVLWWFVLALYLALTIATVRFRNAPIEQSLRLALPGVVTILSLLLVRFAAERRRDRSAFAASSAFIAGMLVAAAATMYPYILPAYPASSGGVSIYAAAPSPLALISAVVITLAGLAGVILYTIATTKRLAGKIIVGEP